MKCIDCHFASGDYCMDYNGRTGVHVGEEVLACTKYSQIANQPNIEVNEVVNFLKRGTGA